MIQTYTVFSWERSVDCNGLRIEKVPVQTVDVMTNDANEDKVNEYLYEELRKRVGGVAPDELAECVTGVLGGEYRKVLWDSNGALRYDVDKVRRILNEIPPPPEEDLEGQFRDEVKAAHECLMEHAHFYRPA